MVTNLITAIILLCHFIRLPGSLFAQDPAVTLNETVVGIVEKIEPSVVSIARIKPPPRNPESIQISPFKQNAFPPADPEHPDFEPNEFGTGIIITAKGGPATANDERLILTNYHIVRGGPVSPSTSTDNGTSLLVRFHDRKSCDASIMAADPRSDLAVLRLHFSESQPETSSLQPIDWSTSSTAKKGQFVVTFGNPYALARDGSASVGWGMISNVTRHPAPINSHQAKSQLLHRLGNLYQIDGRLNLGTSGGPVVNLKGELVGLTTALAAIEGYDKSAGFAIPIDHLTRRIVIALAAGHEVEYGMIGVAPADVSPRQLREYGITMNGVPLKQGSAARIVELSAGAPADQAELESGDILLKINEELVFSHHDLTRIIGLHAPGSELELLVWRERRNDGFQKRSTEPFTVKVRLGKWPVQDDEGIIETVPRYSPWRGLSVDYSTGRQRFAIPDRFEKPTISYRKAVVVLKSANDSPARTAGLQPGDFISHVNRTPVTTPAEFHAAVKSLSGAVTLRHLDGRTTVVRE